MVLKFLNTAFTPSVRAAQAQYYGRTPNLTEAEVETAGAPLRQRIAELEALLAAKS